jgi:hypothetical protein
MNKKTKKGEKNAKGTKSKFRAFSRFLKKQMRCCYKKISKFDELGIAIFCDLYYNPALCQLN